MRNFLCYAAAVAMVMLAFSADAATTAKKKKTAHSASGTTVRKRTATAHTKGSASRSASGSTTSRTVASRNVRSRNGKKTTASTKTTWRNRQLAPTPDRYREIQQALVTKGYLTPDEATGAWNQDSVDALKKFQGDQKLDPSGKINSLSLIALGLGPKRDAVADSPQF